ncbi:hypothetical protein LSH36_1123g00051 [Paralvinella palmiformis]|uniref:CUB domain-containing protein n=1 Tax=Paralvinella palmiformis TaxID=53620 RepID=A0AAD9IVG1_9ANNE|nr:hypothetical protein LSH36_1123g00051 [Paralvinella palmiformis]
MSSSSMSSSSMSSRSMSSRSMSSSSMSSRSMSSSSMSSSSMSSSSMSIRSMSSSSMSSSSMSSSSMSTADCQYEFLSSLRKNGTFTSPHYPNPYPESKRCHYIFQGQGKERVQIAFNDLDLNYDAMSNPGQSCDDEDSVIVSIKIEGQTRDIGRYCGNQKPLMLMSNNNRLDVNFITRNREPTSARGFKATYRFVTATNGVAGIPRGSLRHESIAKRGGDGHVIGLHMTNSRNPVRCSDFGIKSGVQDPDIVCGFEYRSTETRNGTFTSPNFPGLYPRNTECHYIFYGLENERVHIQFPFFDVEGLPPNCDEKTQSDYLEFSNFNIPDRKMSRFCGIREGESKKKVHSDGPFFRVLFKSNDMYDAQGFEAFYQFVKVRGKDFGIKTGVQDPDTACGFIYRSSDARSGTFTSPNFPGLYPRNTECHYIFYGDEERVYITFPFFDVEGLPPNCNDKTDSDYIEFSNFEFRDRKMARYCGVRLGKDKKEVKSDGPFFRVVFKSNDKYDGQGFEAFYQFRRIKEPANHLPKPSVTKPAISGQTSCQTRTLSTQLNGSVPQSLPLLLLLLLHLS